MHKYLCLPTLYFRQADSDLSVHRLRCSSSGHGICHIIDPTERVCSMENQGIVPTLIIVRVGLGVSTQDTAVTLQTGATSSNDARVVFNRAAHRPVRMQVHKVVHVEGGTVDSGSEDPEGTRKHFSLYPNHSSVDV
jgi:hypothetical protein